MRKRIAVLRTRLERLLRWRVWECMLEIEFIDRSIALAGKAFVSFFPLVIVVAALVPWHYPAVCTAPSAVGSDPASSPSCPWR
jgi:hypothetical protein